MKAKHKILTIFLHLCDLIIKKGKSLRHNRSFSLQHNYYIKHIMSKSFALCSRGGMFLFTTEGEGGFVRGEYKEKNNRKNEPKASKEYSWVHFVQEWWPLLVGIIIGLLLF